MKDIASQELPTAKQSSTGGPKPPTEGVHHPLLVHRPHPNGLVEQHVESRTATAGNAQREKLIWDLYAASQIHREPPAGQPPTSSRLHLDMLLGRDGIIDFGDYLDGGEKK